MKSTFCAQNQVIALAAGLVAFWLVSPAQSQSIPAQQQTFDSAADATNALVQAAQHHDREAVRNLFGPDVPNLLTGDQTQDEANFDTFANAVKAGCVSVPQPDGKIVLQIGVDRWPFAIPLAQANGKWFFDTVAGEDEIINRHIGSDEFHAIGVCRAYVQAQRQYAVHSGHYARKLKCTSGKKDGLAYSTDQDQTVTPWLAGVAEAEVCGRHPDKDQHPQPYHGYLFKILDRQGPDASGGRSDYIHHRKLSGGFALVAFPVRWGQSGVMTFIVNQDGTVYQRNFGEKTVRSAWAIREYNPDSQWTLVQDQGITELDK